MPKFSPKHWIYVLVHGLLALVGLCICFVGPEYPLWFAIGTSLLSAGIAGWVIFVYVLVSDDVGRRVGVVTEFGIRDVFDRRSMRIRDQYESRLIAAKESIDILGFGLSALREDLSNDFSRWKKVAKVRILLLDPTFPSDEKSYAKQRDAEEGNPLGDIEKDVRAFLKAIQGHVGAAGGTQFQVRLYRCLPSVNIFRIDDDLFWGPYLVRDQSRNMPTFLVGRGGILFERMSAHFNHIWIDPNLSSEVPNEWMEPRK